MTGLYWPVQRLVHQMVLVYHHCPVAREDIKKLTIMCVALTIIQYYVVEEMYTQFTL